MHLMTILSEDHERPIKQLQHADEQWGYEQLARHFWAIGTSETARPSAPVTKNGAFPSALGVAIRYIKGRCKAGVDGDMWMINIFASMMRRMSIHFVPWHKNANAGGSRPRAVQADVWMIIRQAGPSRGGGQKTREDEEMMDEVWLD